MKNKYYFLLIILLVAGCSKDPEITEDLLDGNTIFDPSLYNPEEFLISKAIPNPTPEQAMRPVVITSHGYTATTFEWNEFREYAEENSEILVSQVLLGGHGRTYEEFKESSWRDWQESIKEEYEDLVQAGFTNIHFLGSSTSGALYLELLSSNYFDDKPAPGQILLVDPVVIPSNKTLSFIEIIGPMLGYLESEQSEVENLYYYRFRPQETLKELKELLGIVRKELEDGIKLPEGSSLKVYKSKKDPTADPVSAVLIYKGVQDFNGGNIDVDMVDSDLHVFTRLNFRPHSVLDEENQEKVFEDILQRVKNQ